MIDLREAAPRVPVPKVDKTGCMTMIAAAAFPKPFRIGLEYAAPARGTWTIAHSPMLIPECHEIYICCACCLHGVVLSADEIPHGGRERFSMVTVTNDNLIRGDLERMMIGGVSDILEGLPQKPRCVECFTSCIQHFLHIDLKLVYRELSARYPEIDFIDGYMIPTLQRKMSPDILGRRQLLRGIKCKNSHDRGVNLLVNYYPVDPESELLQLLKDFGHPVRDFAALQTYDEYQQLGCSSYSIFFAENARAAAEDLERRHGIRAIALPYSYDYGKIREGYVRLIRTFSEKNEAKNDTDRSNIETEIVELPDSPDRNDRCESVQQHFSKKCSERTTAEWDSIFCREEQLCEEAVRHASAVIGDTPIVLDVTATPAVLSLAKFLITHGFQVRAIYADVLPAAEQESFVWLQEHAPELELRAISHYKMRLLPRDDAKRCGRLLAIGQKAAYFTGTEYFVNLIENGADVQNLTERQFCKSDKYRQDQKQSDALLSEARQNTAESDIEEVVPVQLFGYEGIRKLLKLLEEACLVPKDTEGIVQVKAWGCSGRQKELTNPITEHELFLENSSVVESTFGTIQSMFTAKPSLGRNTGDIFDGRGGEA